MSENRSYLSEGLAPASAIDRGGAGQVSDNEVDVRPLMEIDGVFGREHALRSLIDAIDLASDQDRVTWLTDREGGRRIAAIVPVDQVLIPRSLDGLCHEETLAGDCSLPREHSGKHDWER